jgi:spore coat polysaccharide biosynthesis protein SpsF (cytidylyltransferase family)
MTALVVIQARMGSTRLPGKVLADLGGRPLLGLQLARLGHLAAAEVVVATSDQDQDDPIAAFAEDHGVACVRGPESDVLARFALALDRHPADEVVRLTADCPLTDPELVRAALALRRSTDADYAGNTPIRTFPDGLDVEAMTASALRTADDEADEPDDREHVTRFILRRPDRFRLANFRAPVTLADERWTVDTAADLQRVRTIVAALPDPVTAGWEEILAAVGTTVTPSIDSVQPEVAADLMITSLLETEP